MHDAHEYAARLRKAAFDRVSIPPLRESIGVENIELAYAIQQSNTDYRVANGARIVGKKIGLTSIIVQKQIGVNQPDFGILFNDMEVLNGLSISMTELMQPKIEAEIAFVLSKDLDADNLTSVDIIDAVAYALPALEIVGSRISDWNIKITDTVADNASASHFVVGHSPKKLHQIDLTDIKMTMKRNGEVVSSGRGSDCFGSPINATLWLANTMKTMGQPLKKGEIIFTGALGSMVDVKEGDHFTAQFEGLGDVGLHFKE